MTTDVSIDMLEDDARATSAADYVLALVDKHSARTEARLICGAFAGLLAMEDNELAWETIRELEATLDERSEQTQP